MYPLTPFKSAPMSGSQYVGMEQSSLLSLPPHIVQGTGITGPFFERYLLGNVPQEQFTVVMLTYQRNEVLIEALERMEDVAFLNKIVVVWNNREKPPADMKWPNISVPIEVGCLKLAQSSSEVLCAYFGRMYHLVMSKHPLLFFNCTVCGVPVYIQLPSPYKCPSPIFDP